MEHWEIIKVEDKAAFDQVLAQIYTEEELKLQINGPTDQHLIGLYILTKDNALQGRFALYQNPELVHEGEKLLCIGSYECIDDKEAAEKLLSGAKQLARDKRFNQIIGPMEASTWNNYRFSLHHNSQPYLMEPYHHLYYNQQFRDNGFQSIAEYQSRIIEVEAQDPGVLSKYIERLEGHGVMIRNLNMEHFEEELLALAHFSNLTFAQNFLFSPIEPELFVRKYAPMKELMKAEMVKLVVNSDDELQAFVFGMPNYLDPSGDSAILKSLARRDVPELRGLGTFLGMLLTQYLYEASYKSLIHAFIKDDNASLRSSNRFNGVEYSRYALYAWKDE